MSQKITPYLWFDDNAEEAVNLYTSLFENAQTTHISRYPDGGRGEPGKVMLINFQLDGQEFIALNGGPGHQFSDAMSLYVSCTSQEEVDRLWNALTVDGGEEGAEFGHGRKVEEAGPGMWDRPPSKHPVAEAIRKGNALFCEARDSRLVVPDCGRRTDDRRFS